MSKAGITKNYIYNLFYQLLVVLSPIIVTPYLSRVLKADGVGMYQYVYAIASYFIMVVQLGTSMYGQREVAICQNDKNRVGQIFLHIQALRLVMLAVSAVGYGIIIFAMRDSKYATLLWIEFMLVLGAYFDISWLFQGLEQFKLMSVRSSIIKILTIILIFALVKTKSDLYLYAVIMSLGVLIGNLILWVYVPRYAGKASLSKNYFKDVLRNSWIFFIPSIATTIYAYLDKVLLGIFSGDSETGFYSQGEKVVKILITLITSLSLVLLPRITSLIGQEKKDEAKKIVTYVWKYVLMIAIPMTVGLICASGTFVPLFFGDGYDSVIPVIVILAPLAFIIGSNSVLGYAILIPSKQQRGYNIAAIAGCAVNFVADLLLIPICNAIGACVGTILAEFTVCCCEYYYSKKIMGRIFPWKNVLRYVAASIVVAVVLLTMNQTGKFGGVMIFAEVLCGITVYFIFLLIMRDDVLKKLLNVGLYKVRHFMKGQQNGK